MALARPVPHAQLRLQVLAWYAANGRPLAFRATRDPWAILVSEVMAQQTQAARAAEAWTGFMATFPTPLALADASPAAVLRAWRGLGYNRRALALRRAAQAIVKDHAGRVPNELDALLRLPGVGPYTARAVAALAFGLPVGPVDTNVRRVLGRAFHGAGAPDPKALQALADELVPPLQPGLWTHALMDIGATFCRPREPRCGDCPLSERCRFAGVPRAEPAVPRARPPRPATSHAPFRASSRWLRGRILDRLREAEDGHWVDLDGSIGGHDPEMVVIALDRLAHEGLLELRPGSSTEVRLPTA